MLLPISLCLEVAGVLIQRRGAKSLRRKGKFRGVFMKADTFSPQVIYFAFIKTPRNLPIFWKKEKRAPKCLFKDDVCQVVNGL